jgi:hypothetical protein
MGAAAGVENMPRSHNESLFMNRRVNLLHAALLLGPIVLAIIILPLVFGLSRTRNDACSQLQPFGQAASIQSNECR